ncbi:hypothetical protein RND71_038167 [Anisodus tanguticus]|uniref:ATP-dependent RNA helicase n=1 Tax=Anisodus tanguticus TaxID=243964 RepID=A0AAE1QZI4_9SOLA|nr:hypothetical protein RND71_038167 [Anisodus tanguticus]
MVNPVPVVFERFGNFQNYLDCSIESLDVFVPMDSQKSVAYVTSLSLAWLLSQMLLRKHRQPAKYKNKMQSRLVNAATGTGKTVAYLAPVIHQLQKCDPRIQWSDGTFGISILVATPGCLLDHLKNTSSFLRTNLRWIMFDEADRILELGYDKEIEDILNVLGSKQQKSVGKGNTTSQISEVQRQNLLLSATLNEKVNHLSKISLENPVMVGLDKKIELQLAHQDVEPMEFNGNDILGKDAKPLIPCGSRLVVLLAILKHLFEKEPGQKWHSHLESDIEGKQLFLNCNTLRLHGNMNHEDRRTTFNAFKTEKSALLLSTDVAARGLDFPKIRCIIQYDPPGEATEYVHRYHPKNFVSIDTHPWVVSLQKALESFTSSEGEARVRACIIYSPMRVLSASLFVGCANELIAVNSYTEISLLWLKI